MRLASGARLLTRGFYDTNSGTAEGARRVTLGARVR